MKFISILVALILGTAGAAMAQGNAKQPPAKQSAPSESSDAPGHDAQTGKPESGEKQRNDAQKRDKSPAPGQGAQQNQETQKPAAPK
jgi:hypothetical protein